MEGARFVRVLLRRADLRAVFPRRFAARLKGRTVLRLDRRAKYLLAVLSSTETLVMHLGMSGSFRVERGSSGHVEAGKHDHVVFHMSSGFVVTFNDPRRFGFMDLLTAGELATDRALSRLGPSSSRLLKSLSACSRPLIRRPSLLRAPVTASRECQSLGRTLREDCRQQKATPRQGRGSDR